MTMEEGLYSTRTRSIPYIDRCYWYCSVRLIIHGRARGKGGEA